MVMVQIILWLEYMCYSNRFCSLNCGSHGRKKHDKEMEWENGDYLKLEHIFKLKWNFLLDLAMVHWFCLCIVYVTLELNKPIHDLIYLPNGLNIYSLCLKSLSLQFSLADGPSISLKQSHYIPACQHFLLFKVHSQSTHSHTSLSRPAFHSFNLTSLCPSGHSSRAGCLVINHFSEVYYGENYSVNKSISIFDKWLYPRNLENLCDCVLL